MSVQNETIRVTVKLPFKTGEPERFTEFLEATGRKAGPYLSVLAMAAVRDWESSQETIPDNRGGES